MPANIRQRKADAYRASLDPSLSPRKQEMHYAAYESLRDHEELGDLRKAQSHLEEKISRLKPEERADHPLATGLDAVRGKIAMKTRQMDADEYYRKMHRDNPDMPMPSAPPAE